MIPEACVARRTRGTVNNSTALVKKLALSNPSILINSCSASNCAWMEYRSLAAWSGEFRSLRSDLYAFACLPFLINHLGDSGAKKIPIRSGTAGMNADPN